MVTFLRGFSSDIDYLLDSGFLVRAHDPRRAGRELHHAIMIGVQISRS